MKKKATVGSAVALVIAVLGVVAQQCGDVELSPAPPKAPVELPAAPADAGV
jgi:hypothetical protein